MPYFLVKLWIYTTIVVMVFLGIETSLAQKITQFAPNIDTKKSIVQIPYHLEDYNTRKNLYTVNLFYSLDSGRTFQGPLREVAGQVGKSIIEGNDKKIVWQYQKEPSEIIGKPIKFKIVAEYEPLVLGGPGNAAWSLLLPGLGQRKVRYVRWHWLITTFFTYALIGTGVYFETQSDANYQKYLNSRTTSEALRNFEIAQQQKIIATSCLFAGATLWAIDIARVVGRGFKNKRIEQQIIQKNTQPIITSFNGYYNWNFQQWNMGIKLNF
ncbi:MAG: hypothetical protein EAZ55_04160 [Cytophagales bacterium]|nr:MAG: hypothetical protein EAZ55_04160 [Cytophagales bacterium]